MHLFPNIISDRYISRRGDELDVGSNDSKLLIYCLIVYDIVSMIVMFANLDNKILK